MAAAPVYAFALFRFNATYPYPAGQEIPFTRVEMAGLDQQFFEMNGQAVIEIANGDTIGLGVVGTNTVLSSNVLDPIEISPQNAMMNIMKVAELIIP